jgi:hypothetical protein
MTGLTVTFYERALTTSVNDIEHIESRSIPNDGIIKIFFQPAVNINSALAEISAMSQTVLKQMPAADPELQRIHRADPAARHIEQATLRDDLVRSSDQLHPPAIGLRRRCRDSFTLWRQGPAGGAFWLGSIAIGALPIYDHGERRHQHRPETGAARLNRGCDCVGTRRQTFPSEDCRRSRGKKGGHGCQ